MSEIGRLCRRVDELVRRRLKVDISKNKETSKLFRMQQAVEEKIRATAIASAKRDLKLRQFYGAGKRTREIGRDGQYFFPIAFLSKGRSFGVRTIVITKRIGDDEYDGFDIRIKTETMSAHVLMTMDKCESPMKEFEVALDRVQNIIDGKEVGVYERAAKRIKSIKNEARELKDKKFEVKTSH